MGGNPLKFFPIHQKDHSPRPSGIYPWYAGMVQHSQINQCDTSHQQTEEQKTI